MWSCLMCGGGGGERGGRGGERDTDGDGQPELGERGGSEEGGGVCGGGGCLNYACNAIFFHN